MTNRWAAATILSLSLSACMGTSRQAESGSPTIVGNWTWTETSGGKMGTAIGPKTEGYTLSIRFDADGNFEIMKDAASWQSGSWAVSTGDEGEVVLYTLNGQANRGTVIRWSGLGTPPRHLVRFDDSGALILDEGCCDRFQHIFNKSR